MSENWPKCPKGPHHLVVLAHDRRGACDWYCASCLSFRKTLDGISAAPPSPRWIPVSERLPEEKGRFPVLTKESGSRFNRDWNGNRWETSFTVTHWLDVQVPPPPLPVYHTAMEVAVALRALPQDEHWAEKAAEIIRRYQPEAKP